MIQKKDVSSVEVIESHLRRIEAVNPSVNAITVVLDESALEAARKADARSYKLRGAGGRFQPG